MREQEYVFKKESNVIIYGGSFVGKSIYDSLLRAGCAVKAFVDKNADNIMEINGIPVFRLESKEIESLNKEDVIIIIALTNKKEHILVANNLFDHGFSKLIFSSEDENYQSIDQAYEALLIQKDTFGVVLPVYVKLEKDILNGERYYSLDKNGKFHVLMPMELLFTETDEGLRSVYQDVPLLHFFRFLGGNDSDNSLEKYFINQGNRERYMDEKRNFYKECSLEIEMNLPNNSEPVVELNDRGRFIIKTNYEYVIFLLSQNRTKVKCILNKNDFLHFANADAQSRLDSVIRDKQLSYVYTPIANINYYDLPCKREECGKTRLAMICEAMMKYDIDIAGRKLLDAGCCLAYISQHMYRMGAEVTAVEFNEDNFQLACHINDLLYCSEIEMINGGIQNLNKSEQYDIVLMIAVLNWHLDTVLGEEIVETIEAITRKYLIWESGDNIDYEKKWILDRTSFKNYYKIGNTFGNGKYREMGIFEK